MWKVAIHAGVKKALKTLPEPVRLAFMQLAVELEASGLALAELWKTGQTSASLPPEKRETHVRFRLVGNKGRKQAD